MRFVWALDNLCGLVYVQERRHQSIQSRNAEAARHELYEKAKSMATR